MRKEQIVLFLLITSLSLSLLPACGTGGNGAQTSDTSGDATTVISETTAQSTAGTTAEPADAAVPLEFEYLSVSSSNGRNDIEQTYNFINTKEELQFYYGGNEGELEKKALEYFDDAFFEKYIVVLIFRGVFYPSKNEVVSVFKQDGKILLNYVSYRGTMGAPEGINSLLILNRTDYNGEEISKNEEELRYVFGYYPDFDLFDLYWQEIYEDDLAALEKYASERRGWDYED